MAKKKDSMALFEVIWKTRPAQRDSGINVPEWMKPGGEAPPDAEARKPDGEAPTEAAPIAPPARVTLSLSQAQLALAVVGLAIVLVVAFVLGRATVGSLTPAGDAPQATPAIDEVAAYDVGGSPQAPLAFPADEPRVSGRYYLVIQGMRGMTAEHRQAADEIVAYLRGEGVPAEVGTYSGKPRQYVVWSLTGFDASDSPEALGYVGYIEELGQRYKARGGRYEFSHRDREGRLKPWFQRPS